MLRNCSIVLLLLCLTVAPVSQAYPTSILQLEYLAKAPVLVTAVVERVDYDGGPVDPTWHKIFGHAVLHVLRSFPDGEFRREDHIKLKFQTLPQDDSGMNGPAVLRLNTDAIFTFPLKANPGPATDEWRLFVDQGSSLVVPAIRLAPDFPERPTTGQDFLLQEIASAFATGTREEMLAEASYFPMQETKAYASKLTQLLDRKVRGDRGRWALVAASLITTTGIPRPTIAELRSPDFAEKGLSTWTPFARQMILKLGDSSDADHLLVHQFLDISDLSSWGAGITLREFARDPALVSELDSMLKARRPGSLYVAGDILNAGQNGVLADATSLALEYTGDQTAELSETRAACWVLRDFGSDDQYRQFLALIRKYEYQDKNHFDQLWRSVIWSDNKRELPVLEILLADPRADLSGQTYSQIAQSELARLQKLKN
jgi:hypothetical protein